MEPRRSAGSWPPSNTYAHCATSASRQCCSSAQQKSRAGPLACALLHTSGHSSLNSSTASVLMPPLTLALVSASAPPCARATARMNSLSGTRMPASARCTCQPAAAGGARRTHTRQCERCPGSAPRTAQQAHARAPPSPDLAAVDACRQHASAGSMRPRLRADSKHARTHRAAARPASRREGALRSRTAPHPATTTFSAGSLGSAGASARACASPTHTESGTRSSLRLMAYKRCARDFASASATQRGCACARACIAAPSVADAARPYSVSVGTAMAWRCAAVSDGGATHACGTQPAASRTCACFSAAAAAATLLCAAGSRCGGRSSAPAAAMQGRNERSRARAHARGSHRTAGRASKASTQRASLRERRGKRASR